MASTDDIANLIADYKQLLLESLGECNGKESSMVEMFEAYKRHVRNARAKKEIQDMYLVTKRPTKKIPKWFKFLVCPILLALVLAPFIVPEDTSSMLGDMVRQTECVVENNFFISEMSRPIFDCNICKDLKEVPIVEKISKEEFVKKYAYSNIPVLVKHATENWTAIDTFSFKYFQKIYQQAETRRDKTNTNQPIPVETDEDMGPDEGLACQFFPYNTEFDSLMEAMNMSDERASYVPGEKPWYFGWSNCDSHIQKELRKHYTRPYFLPTDSETVAIDWIFMGGTGLGAPIHLDTVSRPSWQAQITGVKTWTVAPVPECEAECTAMDVTVHPGDIFVINTNQWYHATNVNPGAISVVIGSEYD